MIGFDEYQSLGIVYEQRDGRLAIEMNNGKLAFPDRSWSEAKIGVCKIIGIKDRGSYAFVFGHMCKSDVSSISRSDDVYGVMESTAEMLYGDPFVHVKYVTSPVYGKVALILRGPSEVIAVCYNDGTDESNHSAILRIGRRIDFTSFPLASNGEMYSFGRTTSYLKEYTPTLIQDCIVMSRRNKLKVVIAPNHDQYFPDKYFATSLHDGPAYITATSNDMTGPNKKFVICWNYNYQFPSEEFLMQHTSQSNTSSNFAARAYGRIDRDHDSYGICLDVIDRSGLVNISEVYGVQLSLDIYGHRRIMNLREVNGLRLPHRELKDIKYLHLTDSDSGWVWKNSPSRDLIEFDLAISMIDPDKMNFISWEQVDRLPDDIQMDSMLYSDIITVRKLLLRNKTCYVVLRGDNFMTGLSKINNRILQELVEHIRRINRYAKSVMPNTLDEYRSLMK